MSIDTNLALRVLTDGESAEAKKALAFIERAKPGSVMVADVVFFECAWVLAGKSYQFDRPLIAKLLLRLASIPQINCNWGLLERALPYYLKHPAISFIDSCLVGYAELGDATPLVTFDKKLAKAFPESVVIL